MRFPAPLIEATLVRRYKRFLADVRFESGEVATVHVANPGAMTGLDSPDARLWLSRSSNPRRTLPYSWELVEVDLGAGPELVGVDTAKPNALVAEALAAGRIPALRGYGEIRREVRYGANSRADFVLADGQRPRCYLEVKNVHLMRTPRRAEFPDCVTTRGARHLGELAAMAAGGARAVLLFVIQIPSADRFALARDIDPAFAAACDRARREGLEVLAWRCAVSLDGIAIAAPVPLVEG